METEVCPPASYVFRLDPAAMRFDDRAHNRQPHPEAFLLGGEKLLEKMGARRLRDPMAMIAHAHRNHSVAIEGGDMHFALGRRRLAHGLESIVDQSNQDLLKLAGITGDHR